MFERRGANCTFRTAEKLSSKERKEKQYIMMQYIIEKGSCDKRQDYFECIKQS